MPAYLDCNATTPVDHRVADLIQRFLREEFGNAGSRTHEFGARAKQASERARDQVAKVVAAERDEVLFTSGATESNNLAILGLQDHAERSGRRHIVSTQIEHKAVLEPLDALRQRGFEITLIPPTPGGWIDPEVLLRAVRSDTLLVSMMHVNNETGVSQPIEAIARGLTTQTTYLHVDAAQGFGKDIQGLRNKRIDLISISAHKIHGPKGVGVLIARRRGFDRAPLAPLFYGGGQEKGLRPGTLPVALVVGLGLAAELAAEEANQRAKSCATFRLRLLSALARFDPSFNGDQARCLPHVVNLSIPGLDSEAVMVALKDQIAISNGSACTSQSYSPSHVLKAMGLADDRIQGALRFSWSYLTEEPDWECVVKAIERLR